MKSEYEMHIALILGHGITEAGTLRLREHVKQLEGKGICLFLLTYFKSDKNYSKDYWLSVYRIKKYLKEHPEIINTLVDVGNGGD